MSMRKKDRGASAKTVFCLSLGCAKNRVDSERIAGALSEAGYEIVREPRGASVCIVNTCGFLRSAVEENIESILALADLKKNGGTQRVGVVGCLVNRYGSDLRSELPEVDFWAECEDYGAILRGLGSSVPAPACPDRRRLPAHTAQTRYLKLAEGCDNHCSYCMIPSIRGNQKSLPIASLVKEAEALISDGAKEICLVAQDLTAYGDGLGCGSDLFSALDALESSLPQDVWLRLLYLHPQRVTRKLLERVANGRQILPYLDIPIQHASGTVLSAMNRGMEEGALREVFQTARAIRDDFALRTTCMVGFPGETRRDFETLLRFLEDVQFDRAGAFAFSAEEGTPAALLPGQVPLRTKKARHARLMGVQEDISLARQRLFIGRKMRVLIDAAHGDGTTEARSFREAPEIDGVIEIAPPARGENTPRPGDRIFIRITEAFEHDMLGEACEEDG